MGSVHGRLHREHNFVDVAHKAIVSPEPKVLDPELLGT